MISRRAAILAVTFGMASGRLPALAASDYELLKGLDGDRDGTVDLAEARDAAQRVFEVMDRDHDGTVTRHELRGRLSVRELAAADPDHDRTLSKDEYLAVVGQRFKAADADNDGVLTGAELRSKAGQTLLRLLK